MCGIHFMIVVELCLALVSDANAAFGHMANDGAEDCGVILRCNNEGALEWAVWKLKLILE
jgi:hypothetical protein